MNNSEALVPDPATTETDSTRLPEVVGEAISECGRSELDQSGSVRHQDFEHELSALVDTARELAIPYELDTLLSVVTRRAKQLTGASMAFVTLPDAESGAMRVRAATGHGSTAMEGLPAPDGCGLTTSAAAGPVPLWTADYPADERFAHSGPLNDVLQTHQLRSMIVVPLNYGSEVVGALHVADMLVKQFSVTERTLLTSLGDLAGTALKKAVMFEQNADQIARLGKQVAHAEQTVASFQQLGQFSDSCLKKLLEDEGSTALVRTAYERLDSPIAVYGAQGRILETAGEMPEVSQSAVVSAIVESRSTGDVTPLGDGIWAIPMVARGNHIGTLLVRPRYGFTDCDWRIVTLTAQAVAVSLLLDSKLSTAEDDMRGELLDDLLTTPQHRVATNQLAKRANRLGIDFQQPHVVVTIRPHDREQAKKLDFWAASHARHSGGLKTTQGGNVVLLLPGTDASNAAQVIGNDLYRHFGQLPTVAGAGPTRNIDAVSERYRESLRSLQTMTALGATGSSASVRDLGFLGLLLSDEMNVDTFINHVIGPVLDYDRARRTELANTLEAYFQAGSCQTRAADELYVHPNTVARRLEKISELLGSHWHLPQHAVDIQLALRLHRMRHVLSERQPRPSHEA